MEDKNNISNKLMVFNGLTICLILIVFFLIYSIREIPTKKEISGEKITEVSPQPYFDKLTIQAKSVYVYDVKKGQVLYERNSEEQMPLASLTKLMMALTAYDKLPKDSRIVIKKDFLNEEGDSGLLANESWRLKDLLDFSLVVSSNDGARSVASVIGAMNINNNDYSLGRKEFVSMMNQKASEIGLKQTYYINENGLDIDNFSGGYGSAKDVAKLLEYIIANRSELIEATKYERLKINSSSKSHNIKNTNKQINNIRGIIGSKTGYTSQAGGNLVVAFDSSMQRPIIVVVMGSTQEGRFSDVVSIVEATYKYLKG